MVSMEGLSGDEVRDKRNISSDAEGPRDPWRAAEAEVAVAGNSLRIRTCINAGVGERFLKLWPRGIELGLSGEPLRVSMAEYPSVRDQPEVAATELDRLSAMGKIHWYHQGCHPPDLRVCPSVDRETG